MASHKPEIKIKKPLTELIICFVLLTMFYSPAYAQYTKLHDFTGGTNGRTPRGNSLITDGTFLYGMTFLGGINDSGTIFKIKPDGTGYVKLLDFDGTNGRGPIGSFISDGTFLYGTTQTGGTNDSGTIFKIKPDGTAYIKLLDFGNGTIGAYPSGSLITDGTFLYGKTSLGGINDTGTIFKIKPDGTGYVKLLDFDGATNGAWPDGSLITDGTFLYGTTRWGGANDTGTIFKIKPDGTGYVKLLDFDYATNGAYPNRSLVSDGTFLYGMTGFGGPNYYGNIFKIKPDGSGYAKVLDFDLITNGTSGEGSLITDGVFLYGMTAVGGANYRGTVFKYCLRPTFSTDTINTCGSYSWNGNTYTVSGNYTKTISNAEGCDSVMRLNLTIKNSTSDSLFISSCKSFVSPSGKYVYNSSGFYSDTISNSLGCDSVLTIHYIKTAVYDTVFVQRCDTLVSPSGKYIYRTTGIYSDTLVSMQNCDSIITTNLTIKPLHLTLSKSNNISCDTSYATLSATGGDFYKWEPAEGLSDINAANPVATPVVSRTYYVTSTNNFGCSIRDSIVIFVEKKDSLGFIPNVFTPNDDDYNDCFNVSALTQFKSVELTVYNRWGNIVFRTTDPKACWNGKTSSGTDIQEGVYFYILSGTGHCDAKISHQGTITLLR